MCFAGMGFALKHYAPEARPAEPIFVRGFLGAVLLLPWFYPSWKVCFTRKGLKLWVRSFFGVLGVVCLLWNLKNASVPDTLMLSNLTPLFVIFFGLFLGERPTRYELVGGAVVCGGVMFLSSPQASHLVFSVILVGMMGSTFAALAYITLKRAARDFNAKQIVWVFSFCLLVVSGFMGGGSFLTERIASSESGVLFSRELLAILASGVLGLAAQLLMTRAFIELTALSASVLTLSGVLWSVLFDSIWAASVPRFGSLVSYSVIITGLLIVKKK